MSDLISRQAAIDIANDLRDCISVDGYWAWTERLTRLPSAQSEPRWIPVSESLPDGRLNKSYLVQDKDGRLAVGTYTNWGWMFGHYMNKPVAWMPLPKPYEAERKEE